MNYINIQLVLKNALIYHRITCNRMLPIVIGRYATILSDKSNFVYCVMKNLLETNVIMYSSAQN